MEDASGKKTYTFKIDRAVPTAYLENLVLYEKTADTYDAYIVEYDPEVLQNNFPSYEAMKLAIKNHVRQYYLGERSLSDLSSKDTMCYVVESAWVDIVTSCSAGIHSYSDGSDCIYWGGSGAATHNGGGGYWAFTTSYVACSQMGGPTGGSPGGSTGPYGGGGSGSAANDNCKKVKKITDNTTFKNNEISLKGKTGDDFESGYRMNDPIPNGSTNDFIQNALGKDYVIMIALQHTYAMQHSHFSGQFPIFSPDDVILFDNWVNQVIANSQAPNPSNIPLPAVSDISFTVVTSQGTYILMYDDTILATPLPDYTKTEIDNLNKSYIEDYVGKAFEYGSFDMNQLEKEFLKFMRDKMDSRPFKLYKYEDTGNTEIYLEGNSRKTKKCP